MKKFVSPYGATSRRNFVLLLLGVFATAVLGRVIYLQSYRSQFLVDRGNERFVRVRKEPALRGTILDRNNIPLAVSTPVSSLWVNPHDFEKNPAQMQQLSSALAYPLPQLQKRISNNKYDKNNKKINFVYIKRGLEPTVAKKITDKIPGVYRQREYRRFYPSADVTAQIIGFNNADDKGLEGIERLYNPWLSGTPGTSKIIQAPGGKVVDISEESRPSIQGQDLQLTIDKRIQYLTYSALLETAAQFSAKSATAVVLDAKTSEVLAMVSVPSGNPNNSKERRFDLLMNRAINDTFEPGSVMKIFTVASALEASLVRPSTPIDTRPGSFLVGKNLVEDIHNYGKLTVADVIKKSSNVGTCKVALRLPKGKLHAFYEALGLGQKSQIGFPGEQKGILRNFKRMNDFDYCTNAYGYGVSVTALQLAQAYAVLANDGLSIPATLVKREAFPTAIRILSKRTASQVRRMLSAAVSTGGTGRLATRGDYMEDYRVGGKTGTVHKVFNGGYAEKRYRSVFAGMAPLSDPRIVMVVMVDEPQGDKYYGGLVAAPVFAKVVGKTLRMMGVAPDKKDKQPTANQSKKSKTLRVTQNIQNIQNTPGTQRKE